MSCKHWMTCRTCPSPALADTLRAEEDKQRGRAEKAETHVEHLRATIARMVELGEKAAASRDVILTLVDIGKAWLKPIHEVTPSSVSGDKCKHGFTHAEAEKLRHECASRGWFFPNAQATSEAQSDRAGVEARIATTTRIQTRERCAQELYDLARWCRDNKLEARARHTESAARRLQGVDDEGKVIAALSAESRADALDRLADVCPDKAEAPPEVPHLQARLAWGALTDAAEHYTTWEETGLSLEAATADLHTSALAYANAYNTIRTDYVHSVDYRAKFGLLEADVRGMRNVLRARDEEGNLACAVRAAALAYPKPACGREDEDAAMLPLATYILDFFNSRNRAELSPAIGALSAESRSLLLEELSRILRCGGHPPNWTPDTRSDSRDGVCFDCSGINGAHHPNCENLSDEPPPSGTCSDSPEASREDG